MKKDPVRSMLSMLTLTIILAGCGGNAPTPSASASTSTSEAIATTISITPDPCVSPQLEAAVQRVQRHMREFDDASTLASNVPQAQLSVSIADLQRIRREADDEQVPACLTDLKTYQINHMNSVINTLLAFLRSSDPRAIDCNNAQPNTESEAICKNIAVARQQHDQYLIELSRLLGITIVPATEGAAGTPSETPTP